MSIRILIMGPSLYCFDIFSNQFHSFGWSDSLFPLVDLMIFSICGSHTRAWSISLCETLCNCGQKSLRSYKLGIGPLLFCMCILIYSSVCIDIVLESLIGTWPCFAPWLVTVNMDNFGTYLTLNHKKVLGNGWVWDPCWTWTLTRETAACDKNYSCHWCHIITSM